MSVDIPDEADEPGDGNIPGSRISTDIQRICNPVQPHLRSDNPQRASNVHDGRAHGPVRPVLGCSRRHLCFAAQVLLLLAIEAGQGIRIKNRVGKRPEALLKNCDVRSCRQRVAYQISDHAGFHREDHVEPGGLLGRESQGAAAGDRGVVGGAGAVPDLVADANNYCRRTQPQSYPVIMISK